MKSKRNGNVYAPCNHFVKNWVAILISHKVYFRIRIIIRNKEDHFIMI